MGRPRNRKNRNLPEGLYTPIRSGASWRIRHPLTGKVISLNVTTEAEARKLYSLVWPKIQDEVTRANAEKLHAQIHAIGSRGKTIGQLAEEFLQNELPKMTRKKAAKAISESTKNDYGRAVNLVIQDLSLKDKPLSMFNDLVVGLKTIRQHLADSRYTPSWHNTRRDALSRLFGYAVSSGQMVLNPMREVEKANVPEREVIIPAEHLIRIADQLGLAAHEVYARVVDLLYLTAGSVDDILSLRDELNVMPNGDLAFTRRKTEQPLILRDPTGEIHKLVTWFRDYKRRQGLISPYLMVHPCLPSTSRPEWLTKERAVEMTGTAIAEALGISEAAWRKRVKQYGFDQALSMGTQARASQRRLSGQRILVAHLRDRWDAAVESAGLKEYGYTLRDIRATSLTAEAELQGEATNKGGHRTDTMKRRYVKKRLPMIVQNNLKLPRR